VAESNRRGSRGRPAGQGTPTARRDDKSGAGEIALMRQRLRALMQAQGDAGDVRPPTGEPTPPAPSPPPARPAQPAAGPRRAKRKTNPRLQPALRRHDEYVRVIRNLTAAQRARIARVLESRGVLAAIVEAKRLRGPSRKKP
jgi:hypothetical protein